MDRCGWCGKLMWHYLTHICVGCTCTFHEMRIPGEPHIPSYFDMEWDPDCPVHKENEDDD